MSGPSQESSRSAFSSNRRFQCVVVVPCYNECSRLNSKAFVDFARLHPKISFVFVNDGSQDETATLLDACVESVKSDTTVLHLPVNVGKAEAVRQGVQSVLQRMEKSIAISESGLFIGYWDADLATPLADIPVFCELLADRPTLEMVMGARVKLLGRHIHRRILRHYLGRCFATAVSCCLAIPIYDTQCGAKIFRVTEQTPGIFATPFHSRWIFDVEILARMLSRPPAGTPWQSVIYEHPLMAWEDMDGSKLRIRDFAYSAYDLAHIAMRFWLRQRESNSTKQS